MAHSTPAELFALSALVGGTGYGATRSISSVLSNLRNKPKENGNTLTLPVMENAQLPQVEKVSNTITEGVMSDLERAGAGVAGLGAGWLGARSIYNTLKQKQLDAEAKKHEEERNNILADLSKKGSELDTSKYPNTEAFCAGVMKVANGPSIGEVLQHGVSKAIPAIGNTLDAASGGMVHHALASLVAVGLLSAGGTYAASKAMENRNDSQNRIPTQIKVVRLPGRKEPQEVLAPQPQLV